MAAYGGYLYRRRADCIWMYGQRLHCQKDRSTGKSDHVYGEYQPDGNATCLADGTKTRVCSVCKAQETVADPGSATGHKYGAYQPDGNATCLADGTKTRVCSACKGTGDGGRSRKRDRA